jgi:hypothetical protein
VVHAGFAFSIDLALCGLQQHLIATWYSRILCYAESRGVLLWHMLLLYTKSTIEGETGAALPKSLKTRCKTGILRIASCFCSPTA